LGIIAEIIPKFQRATQQHKEAQMTSTLLIVQIVLALAITIAVLLQKSSSIGLGAYSGSNESVFGAKGPTGFLAKLTFILGFAFIINTLALGYLYTAANTSSVADSIIPANNAAVPTAPLAPVPTANTAMPETQIAPESATPVVPESAAEVNDSLSTKDAGIPADNKATEAEENTTSSVPTIN